MNDRPRPKYNNGRFKRIEYFLKSFRAPLYKLFNFRSENKFECPICGYYGPFMDKRLRKHAKCPKHGKQILNQNVNLEKVFFEYRIDNPHLSYIDLLRYDS